MGLPSFNSVRISENSVKPRIYVLEIREKGRPDSDPIAWMFIERQEFYDRNEKDGSIREASIILSYERIEPKGPNRAGGKGTFSGSYSSGLWDDPIVSLTSSTLSEGAVFLSLPGLEGQRIGTYLMNEIVIWALQWPDAKVDSIKLLSHQSYDENKLRRNKLYEQFKIEFTYLDNEKREGVSKPMLARQLTPVEKWKENLRELNVLDFMGEVLHVSRKHELDIARCTHANMCLSEEISQAKARPLGWAIRRLLS